MRLFNMLTPKSKCLWTRCLGSSVLCTRSTRYAVVFVAQMRPQTVLQVEVLFEPPPNIRLTVFYKACELSTRLQKLQTRTMDRYARRGQHLHILPYPRVYNTAQKNTKVDKTCRHFDCVHTCINVVCSHTNMCYSGASSAQYAHNT